MKGLVSYRVRSEGTVLILTMWVLFMLTLLALGIKSHVDSQVFTAGVVRNQLQGRYLARAGASMATWVVRQDTNDWDAVGEPWTREGTHRESVGVVNWTLQDEESRLNINRSGGELLKNFLQLVGERSEEEATVLAASIIDWRDEDDVTREGGAESDYYQARVPGYTARNHAFANRYELLLVKGIDNELFSLIQSNITVHGAGHINLNTASEDVLLSLARTVDGPGEEASARQLVQKLVDYRADDGVFKVTTWSDIAARLSLTDTETLVLRRMIDHLTVKSAYFTGLCAADIRDDQQVENRIRFTLHRESGGIVDWYEE